MGPKWDDFASQKRFLEDRDQGAPTMVFSQAKSLLGRCWAAAAESFRSHSEVTQG
jgi:hypothetical protein